MSLAAEKLDTWQEALSATGANLPPRADCPTTEDLWSAAHAELASSEAREVVSHVASCLVCTEAWDLALDMGGGRQSLEGGSRPLRPFRARGQLARAFWLAAAVVVLAVALPKLRESSIPMVRGEAEFMTTRVPADAVLPREDCSFRWRGPSSATSYDLRLSFATIEQLDLVAEIQGIPAKNGGGHFRVSSEDLQNVPSMARLLWQITAWEDGEQISQKVFATRLE